MAADTTTWSDVWLALAGAPIGAGITVFGVWLTNRHNTETNKAMLDSQAAQQRERMEFELKSELQRETLTQRSKIYESLLEVCDLATHLASWGGAAVLPDDQRPITNNDLRDTQQLLPTMQYRVYAHCSYEVRQSFDVFRDSLKNISEVSEPKDWNALSKNAANLQACVIEAALLDRTGGVARDGLGGM